MRERCYVGITGFFMWPGRGRGRGELHFKCLCNNTTRMRELFIDAFRPFVSDIKKYGLHSLRPGLATTAADWFI
jgi:hypothetical protein